MTEIILTIVALITLLCIFIFLKVRNYDYYNGFANKTMNKALNGEISSKDIKDIHNSIALDKKNKEEMMRPKTQTVVPLN